MSVGFQPFAESTSQGHAVLTQTRSESALSMTKSPGLDQGSSIPTAFASSIMVLKKKFIAGHPARGRTPYSARPEFMLSEQFLCPG